MTAVTRVVKVVAAVMALGWWGGVKWDSIAAASSRSRMLSTFMAQVDSLGSPQRSAMSSFEPLTWPVRRTKEVDRERKITRETPITSRVCVSTQKKRMQ